MKLTKRPWGNFKEFVKNKKCTVKIIEVKPNQELSLQYHKHRAEVWYFLDSGYVVLGNKKKKVKEGDIVRVPLKKLHRVGAYKDRVRFLEIATGDFKEGDIIRIKDKYGRK